MIETEPEVRICVAVLEKSSGRMPLWVNLFREARVPVTEAFPKQTMLPGASEFAPCYFVDFDVFGEAGLEHLNEVNERNPQGRNYAAVKNMLASRIYPVVSREDVIIVEARLGFWRRE